MKTIKIIPVALLSIFAISFASCSEANESEALASKSVALLNVTGDGVSNFELNNVCSVFVATDPLTADEIEFLYAVREDEKLAKDVTEAFLAKYPTSVAFNHIASAEATHIAAIENVLGYYEIAYPALGEAGVFANETRQNRYNEMMVGGTSLVAAYKTTALLEEESVMAYAAVTPNITNANVKLVVSNLMRGSSNHLKAYARQLTTLGEVYLPATMDQATYDGIINSPFGQGNKYQKQGKNGMNNKNGNGMGQGQGQGQQGNKGTVNNAGTCTGTTNGTAPGTGVGTGGAGKGYRGGK